MGQAVIDAISILGTVIGLFGLSKPGLPAYDTQYNTVRPYVADFGGMSNDGHPGTIKGNPGGGGKLQFTGRSIRDKFAGQSVYGHYNRGEVNKQALLNRGGSGADRLAERIEVSAGLPGDKNAICVVGLALSTADGQHSWVWSGDNWASCTAQKFQWHYGGAVLFGNKKTRDGYTKPYRPNCMWLGTPETGCTYPFVGIGMSNYHYKTNETVHTYCTSPDFLRPRKFTGTKRENAHVPIPAGARPHKDNLIVSDIVEHSAAKLCQSPTSFGPDFINVHEGLYCDMSDHTLWPLCTAEHDGVHCFELEHGEARLRSTDEERRPTRQFKEIVYHHENGDA